MSIPFLTRAFLILTTAWIPAGLASAGPISRLRITVVFDNVLYSQGMITGWGFAAVIEGPERTILFDTGGSGDILLANMKRLGIDPNGVDVVVLSHIHADHTGGLNRFLEENSAVEVYLPASFPTSFEKNIQARGATTIPITQAQMLFDNVYTSGEMENHPKEQALILKTEQGLVVMTGCAHPGIVEIVRLAKARFDDEVYLIIGGFHLLGESSRKVGYVIQELKHLGLRKIAPSHCTGEAAIAQFREAWGDDFIKSGCGAVIELP